MAGERFASDTVQGDILLGLRVDVDRALIATFRANQSAFFAFLLGDSKFLRKDTHLFEGVERIHQKHLYLLRISINSFIYF